MDIDTIIAYLEEEEIVGSGKWNCKTLTGGTMSQVHLLTQENGMDLVIKQNSAKVSEAEAAFLAAYQPLALLPNLVVVDTEYRFIAYVHIPGSAGYTCINKKELLQSLVVGLLNHYQRVSSEAWGWPDEPVNSWEQFLSGEIQAATEILTPYMNKKNIRLTAPCPPDSDPRNVADAPYRIHGDCGIHNFIFREDGLAGVIDPTPIMGHPHYDLIYAFFSSPEDLSQETLDSAFSLLSAKLPGKKQLYEETRIGLYLRLGSCVKHHPADLPLYLKAWDYWNTIVDRQ